jgi:hypothetical protein
MNVVHSPFFEKADRHVKGETKCSLLEKSRGRYCFYYRLKIIMNVVHSPFYEKQTGMVKERQHVLDGIGFTKKCELNLIKFSIILSEKKAEKI